MSRLILTRGVDWGREELRASRLLGQELSRYQSLTTVPGVHAFWQFHPDCPLKSCRCSRKKCTPEIPEYVHVLKNVCTLMER